MLAALPATASGTLRLSRGRPTAIARLLRWPARLVVFRHAGFRGRLQRDGTSRHERSNTRLVTFPRFAGDHHAFVLFPRWAFEAARIPKAPGTWSIAHAAWQVGSLRELSEGLAWAREREIRITRPPGRDLPGGNWTFTMGSPDGIVHELYYGMDQIGWHGLSRPSSMYGDAVRRLPGDEAIASESLAIAERIRRGVDLASGLQATADAGAHYDVGGRGASARPFRIVGHGPLRLFASDLDAALRHYVDVLGLSLTEERVWQGHRAAFLRAGSEHHAIALYDVALRDTLGLRRDSRCACRSASGSAATGSCATPPASSRTVA